MKTINLPSGVNIGFAAFPFQVTRALTVLVLIFIRDMSPDTNLLFIVGSML